MSGISELERESKVADHASVEVEPSTEMKPVRKVPSTLPMDDSECETNPLHAEVMHCPPQKDQQDEHNLADPVNEETHGKDETGQGAISPRSSDSGTEGHEVTPR